MSLKLCLTCGHPLTDHTRDGCTEIPDYDESDISEDGSVPGCPRDRPGWGTGS